MYKDLLTEFMTAEKNAVDELIRQTGKQYDKVIDAHRLGKAEVTGPNPVISSLSPSFFERGSTHAL